MDIGGRSLQLSCTGAGSPTVILEAGLGGDLRTWEHVQPPALAERGPTSAPTTVRAPAGVCPRPRRPPRVPRTCTPSSRPPSCRGRTCIVGFSFGGLITQQYASTFPDEVAGLVLVESLHPEEIPVFEEHLTRRQIEEDRASALGNPEGMDPFASVAEIAKAGPLPAVPLVVISAGIAAEWPPGYDAQLFDRLRDELQKDLARSVPDGRRVIAEHSGHEVPREEPDVVVQAVTSVLDEAGRG